MLYVFSTNLVKLMAPETKTTEEVHTEPWTAVIEIDKVMFTDTVH